MAVWEAEVSLPNAIHAELRRFKSSRSWNSEKWAKRDAAYVAYKKLYKAKQVDENLMPLVKTELQSLEGTHKRLPKVNVENLINIWRVVGKKWANEYILFLSTIKMVFSCGKKVEVDMLLPTKVPYVDTINLHWTVGERVTVSFGPSRPVRKTPELMDRARKTTFRLLHYMHRTKIQEHSYDFAYLFIPCEGNTWLEFPENVIAIADTIGKTIEMGVIFDKANPSALYSFIRWRKDVSPLQVTKRASVEDLKLPVMEVARLSKRRDYLHIESGRRNTAKTLLLLPNRYVMDRLPWKYSQLALMLPFAIDRVGKALLAEDMKTSLDLTWIPSVMAVQALTASSARDPVDYQRLEFLGDSALKVLVSVSLMDEHPLWHEGYLSGAKDRAVSNTTASKAAVQKNLSRWIITNTMTVSKWRPNYITANKGKPVMKSFSTKVLADVVEALIGVAYLNGGFEGATKCCSHFEFGLVWKPLRERVESLIRVAENDAKRYNGDYPGYFSEVESIIGYKFKNRALLLEAITHPSFAVDSTSTSYQRLEFLGDAILDIVVVNRLYKFPGVKLSQIEMHQIKSCCVNANFLAFLCLGTGKQVDRYVPSDRGNGKLQKKQLFLPLYKYLRTNHPEIIAADSVCFQRHSKIKHTIAKQLEKADEYPWTDLTGLDAPKHMSDMLESIIAAMWIDSRGNFSTVEAFAGRIGVIKILDRLVTAKVGPNRKDRVNADHPMSRFGLFTASRGGTVKYRGSRDDLTGTYKCCIIVSGEKLCTVSGAVSMQHAKTWGAANGLKILQKRNKAGVAVVRPVENADEDTASPGESEDDKAYYTKPFCGNEISDEDDPENTDDYQASDDDEKSDPGQGNLKSG
jgi:dsRNA-specific ribonuclease